RVRSNVSPNGRLERDRATKRIIDRSREGSRRGSLRRAMLEMHAKRLQNRIGVGEHVHEVRDRRTLIPRDIRHAGLEQSLRNGENAFAAKLLAGAKAELADFLRETPFRHTLNV